MDWSQEALSEINKAPPFVRRLARAAVERRVSAAGRDTVTVADVRAARPGAGGADPQAELETLVSSLRSRAEKLTVEAEGHVLRCCAGAVGCPRAVVDTAALRDEAQRVLDEAKLGAAVRAKLGGRPLLLHHKFKVALAGCPNACSEPQISDFGAIGRSLPAQSGAECTLCGACEAACHENAVSVGGEGPQLSLDTCIACGDCVRACPTGHLVAGHSGYALLLGGHLGRHPRLAVEVPGLRSGPSVVAALRRSVDLFVREMRPGERFSAVVERMGASRVAGDPVGGGERA